MSTFPICLGNKNKASLLVLSRDVKFYKLCAASGSLRHPPLAASPTESRLSSDPRRTILLTLPFPLFVRNRNKDTMLENRPPSSELKSVNGVPLMTFLPSLELNNFVVSFQSFVKGFIRESFHFIFMLSSR